VGGWFARLAATLARFFMLGEFRTPIDCFPDKPGWCLFSKGAVMSSIRDAAEHFYVACETGKGWDGCQEYCHAGATFSCQADALDGVNSLEGYTEWMKGLLTPVPDGHYEIRSLAVDDARNNVVAYGVFRGTHTGEGGPLPPTGNKVEADYAYVMDFDGDRIRHMTKIWNDVISLKQLGWM
jgi:predicted ester cyclase